MTAVHVLTHGHCFDGLVSAALFTRLLRELEPSKKLAFSYRSCGYGPKLKRIPSAWLAGEINAILDFRYAENDKLSYYFDHHKTAFESDKDQRRAVERVRASKGARKLHFDPSGTSCAKLIARVAEESYGVKLADTNELVEWADRVDSARFESAEDAFYARAEALLLSDVVERHGDTPFVTKYAAKLAVSHVNEVAREPEIQELASPLAAAKERFLGIVRQTGVVRGDVSVTDLGAQEITPAGKFATYVAFPTCRYSVILLRTRDQLKLGVGFNPWSGAQREHDIAALCKAEGGGGHPVVGAVNFAHGELDRARGVMARMVEVLGR